MFNKITLYLKNFDWILFVAVLFLVCFGLIEIYSIALGQNEIDLLNFKKQIFFIAAGLAVLFVFAFWDYYNLRSYSVYIYLFGAALLLGVLFFGQEIRGTKGWFYLWEFGLQPVEFIKFILILFLARYFSSASLKINPLKHLAITALGTFVFIALVLLQPDFGSALILFLLWFSMVALAGFKKKYFIVIVLILSILMAGGWTFIFKDYQKQRVITFINPSNSPLKQGYNVAQSIIAVGSGGLAGRGLGFGSQSQLKFLPEAQTDFVFAVVAEELGFLGVSLAFIFFAVFFYRCLAALKNVNNDFGVFFILGGMSLIFIEMFINIGMNIGLLPVVGISLPFLSYGGSAMFSKLMIVGVIESIIIRSKINY
ncbi:rod shape-determining protein RodA [Patescibacteria group bacterium]|nr:rod shape-determining protein RodA [Candidatus Falkowbacteria bacterium]MBU3906364.1 rod shape-determining protein RodA [Patescibacteria group bacterium]MCG2698729.1 rod shape-determining protein RodA [Candidatus Parcubacteria bacterium]MBU4014645.1 rod shape-determining protein RodA [Patescibacteria group bacterium]MBU4026754.1 rod shape-determining protein RodA [Patescibacteria group bacterium]